MMWQQPLAGRARSHAWWDSSERPGCPPRWEEIQRSICWNLAVGSRRREGGGAAPGQAVWRWDLNKRGENSWAKESSTSGEGRSHQQLQAPRVISQDELIGLSGLRRFSRALQDVMYGRNSIDSVVYKQPRKHCAEISNEDRG